MEYIIGNEKGVYIRLGKTGCPESCVQKAASRFGYTRAKHILDNLPKTQKRFNYRLIPVNDLPAQIKDTTSCIDTASRACKTISHTYYSIPKEIEIWIEKIKSYNGLVKEALTRKQELLQLLSNIDKESSNLHHEIRFTKPMDACNGYKVYRKIKEIEDKRGGIKDELEVVSFLLSSVQQICTEKIDLKIDKLKNRVFTYREIEDEL